MLDLVGAIEHHGHQIRLVIFEDVFGDLEPLLLARQVIAHPLGGLVGRQRFHRLLFLVEVPGQFLRIEARNLGLDAFEQFTRMRVAAQMLGRSEEHTSELQSLMRISYAVFCLKKKKHNNQKKYAVTTKRHTSKL